MQRILLFTRDESTSTQSETMYSGIQEYIVLADDDTIDLEEYTIPGFRLETQVELEDVAWEAFPTNRTLAAI